MISLIRSEWIKLRTVRSNITMTIVAVLIPVAITLLTTVFVSLDTVDDSTVSAVLLGSGSVSVLLFGIIGVLAITQEYSQGTIRLTLAATPRRTRVFVAKAMVMILVSSGLSLLIIVIGNFGGQAILESRGAMGSLSYDGMGQAYAALAVMSILVSLLGMAIGTLTRNPPSAITFLVLWPLLLENLIGGLLSVTFSDDLWGWLPFQTGLNAVQVNTYDLEFGRWGSIGYFAIWVLAFSLAGHTLLKRRDA